MDFFLILLLTSAIIISVVEDLRRRKIPNLVTFPTMLLAMLHHTVSRGSDGLFFSATGLAVGVGFFIVPYLLGKMGAGDAKLMGAAGAIFGPNGICLASIIVYVAGGVYATVLFAMNPRYTASFLRRSWTTFKTLVVTSEFILIPPEKDEKQPILRFALPIAVGTLVYMFARVTGYAPLRQLLGDNLEIFRSLMY